MGRVEERIKELGYEIPECPTPVAAYVVAAPAVEGLLFVSGQTAVVDGKEKYIGVVGKEISVEEAYDAARIAALRLIAEVKAVIGDLDSSRRLSTEHRNYLKQYLRRRANMPDVQSVSDLYRVMRQLK